MPKPRISITTQSFLKDISIDEVEFLVSLQKKVGIEKFYKLVVGEAERRKNIIFRLPESDPVKLAIEKAALRGGVEALYSLVEMIKASPGEMDRRLKEDNSS